MFRTIETLETRCLFAVTPTGSPQAVGTINTATSADFVLSPIGTTGNTLVAFPNANKLFGRIVGPTGAPVGDAFQISTDGQNVSKFTGIDAVTDADGNVFVAYSIGNFSNTDFGEVFVVKLDSAGARLLDPINVSNLPATQLRPSLAIGSGVLAVAFEGSTSSFGRNSAVYFTTLSPTTGAILSAAANISVLQDPLPAGGTLDRSPSLVYSSLTDQFTVVFLRATFNAQNNFQGQELDARTITPAGVPSAQTTVFAEPGNNVTLGVPRATSTPAGVALHYSRTFFSPENLLQYQSSAIISNFLGNDAVPDAAPVTVLTASGTEQIGLGDVVTIPAAPVPAGGVGLLATGQDPSLALLVAKGLNDFNQGGLVIADFRLLIVLGVLGTVSSNDSFGPTKSDPKGWFTGPSTFLGASTTVDGSTTTVSVTPASVTTTPVTVNPTVVVLDAVGTNGIPAITGTVKLSKAATAVVRVLVKTQTDPNATAQPNRDYIATSETVTFAVGQTERPFTVPLVTTREPTTLRTFKVDIESIEGPAIAGGTAATWTVPSETAPANLYSVTVGLAALPATVVPGQTVKAAVTVTNNSTTASPAPRGNGTVTLWATFAGGMPVALAEIPVNLTARPGKSSTFNISAKIKSPLDPGTAGTLGVTYTNGPKSAVPTGKVATNISGGPTTIETANIAKAGSPPLNFNDSDNTLATLSVTGPGEVRIVTNDDGSRDLVATGTTAATSITLKVGKTQLPGNDRRITLRNVTANGPAGRVTAGDVDVTRNITFTGPLTSGVFGNVRDQHLITLAAAGAPVTLTFLSLQNVTLSSAQPIRSLTVREWLDTDSTPDVLTAPSIDRLTSTGNFEAGLTVAGAVKSLTVSAVLGGSSLHTLSAATFGTVTARSVQNTRLFAGVASESLPTSRADFTPAPSTITAFILRGSGFSNTSIAARTIGRIAISGVTTTNPTPFGIAATSIASYSNGPTRRARITTPTTLESAGAFSALTV